jgi:hypothetical protein
VATALVAALVGLAGVVPYPSGSSRVAAWSVHVTAPQEGRGPSPVSLERYVTDLVGRIMIKGIA